MLSTLNSVITGALAMGNFGLEKAIYFQLILLGVFVVATLVGYKLISNVPTLLHTPLMSGMNALSGVTVLGALSASASLFKLGTAGIVLSAIFGSLAIALAMVNVVGGFMVTDRMLGMIAKKKAKGQSVIYAASAVAGAGLLAVICCMDVIAKGAGTSARDWVYLAMAIVLSLGVLVGIAMMGKVAYSKIGNRFSAICMLLAIILIIVYGNGTSHIAAVWTLYIGLALGTVAGIVLAKKVKMIQMPQMVALLNGLGGAASAIVGAFAMLGVGTGFDAFSTTTSALALAVGMITLIGSLVAAGKLHKILPQKPVVYKGHQAMTVGSLCLTLALIVVFAAIAALSGSGKIALGIDLKAFCGIMIALLFVISGFFGYIFAIRVGGADMPITISLLNSLSGVAGAIAGLAINDLLLVAVGGIVGASGLLLTQIMCKAMNRKLGAILLGGTSSNDNAQKTAPEKVEVKAEAKPAEVKKEVKAEEKPVVKTEINYAATLNNAKEVIIVPGYGMAIAQAQHLVKQLADKLTANGTKVKYAIHPVAGRMPGHMNVLLCEANVEYEDLFEMDDINPEFKTADATIVIGANDVLNPAANTAEGTPIYGMPVLDVADCKNIFIFNYDLKPGYAGVDNPIYTRENGVHLYLGNAQETLQKFIADMDKPVETTTEVKAEKTEAKPVEVKTETNYAASLNGAKEVIIVPGYGMAIAQAQHLVKQLADKLAAGGTKVKYAIHPVAGRMPGHMNVLLCEADVDYEDLYEMDDINPEFKTADATIVIGANDVLNPAANTAEGTPIYGMPVLDVADCKNIFIFNYDLKPGYAGVDNPLYSREKGVHLYLGNAQDTLQKFIADMDKPSEITLEKAEEEKPAAVEEKAEEKPAEKVENPAKLLRDAKEVIIVPGYGMAIAQAQHLVKQLADKLTANGTKVKYAIHPVAGRMPGHMNVLLCEADVDYEDLYEMDDINPEFKTADATIVIGANDVLNPAANTAEGTPIYGMPVLDVADCKNIFIFNYDLKPGYAGVDNPLYTRDSGVYLYLGNAQETLQKFISDIDA